MRVLIVHTESTKAFADRYIRAFEVINAGKIIVKCYDDGVNVDIDELEDEIAGIKLLLCFSDNILLLNIGHKRFKKFLVLDDIIDISNIVDIYKSGNYDKLFIPSPKHVHMFRDNQVDTEFQPLAADTLVSATPTDVVSDIFYIGDAGINIVDNELFDKTQTIRNIDVKYVDKIPSEIFMEPDYHKRYNKDNTDEMDRRAEYLIRLGTEFGIRLYNLYDWDFDYNVIRELMYSGHIIFNYDNKSFITQLVWDALISNRLVITNHSFGIDELFTNGAHLRWYMEYNDHTSHNFKYDYLEVRNMVDHYVRNPHEANAMAASSEQLCRGIHSYIHRAHSLLTFV